MDGLYNTTKNLLNPESRVISGSFSINSANSSPTKTNIDYIKSSLNDRDIGRLNYREFEALLLSSGYELNRQNGSHKIYTNTENSNLPNIVFAEPHGRHKHSSPIPFYIKKMINGWMSTTNLEESQCNINWWLIYEVFPDDLELFRNIVFSEFDDELSSQSTLYQKALQYLHQNDKTHLFSLLENLMAHDVEDIASNIICIYCYSLIIVDDNFSVSGLEQVLDLLEYVCSRKDEYQQYAAYYKSIGVEILKNRSQERSSEAVVENPTTDLEIYNRSEPFNHEYEAQSIFPKMRSFFQDKSRQAYEGDLLASYILADTFIEGKAGVTQNIKKAIWWLGRIVAQHTIIEKEIKVQADAYYKLAELYEYGKISRKLSDRYAKSYEYYLLSAKLGNTHAMYRLVLGFQHDKFTNYMGYKEVVHWLLLAAEKGNTDAINGIAEFLGDIEPNNPNSRKIFEISLTT